MNALTFSSEKLSASRSSTPVFRWLKEKQLSSRLTTMLAGLLKRVKRGGEGVDDDHRGHEDQVARQRQVPHATARQTAHAHDDVAEQVSKPGDIGDEDLRIEEVEALEDVQRHVVPEREAHAEQHDARD